MGMQASCGLGCATKLWVTDNDELTPPPDAPKIFPPIGHDAAAQGNNAIRFPDGPVHSRLFQPLSNDGAETCLQHAGANKEAPLLEIGIPHPFLCHYSQEIGNLAARVARNHHDKINGSGYLRGISLNDRMVEIVAVCESMTP
jgi:hypothetical protein